MNKFIGIGRLTKDPELMSNSQGVNYCRFTIAIDNSYMKDGEKIEQADFINCLVWRGVADSLCKYQKKGKLIAVEGRLHPYSYEKEDGTKGYSYDVVVSRLAFLESKGKDSRPEPEYEGDIEQKEEEDPFADFGASVQDDDNILE